MARGYLELGRVWVSLGTLYAQPEMVELGQAMLATSALLRRDMAASMNRSVIESDPSANGTRCWPFMADPVGRNCTNVRVTNVEITPWRTYAEWMLPSPSCQ